MTYLITATWPPTHKPGIRFADPGPGKGDVKIRTWNEETLQMAEWRAMHVAETTTATVTFEPVAPTRTLADDRRDPDDVCECEHLRDQHNEEKPYECTALTMQRRAKCSCPVFKKARS